MSRGSIHAILPSPVGSTNRPARIDVIDLSNLDVAQLVRGRISATTMIRCGVNRRSSTTLNCVAAMSAIAPAPNTSAKLCWFSPWRPCRTKDAPEM